MILDYFVLILPTLSYVSTSTFLSMLIAWQCMIHLFAFIGEQREFLPLHWASRTGQLDMVCFHLESTDVDCTDGVSLESCIVGYKDWANAVFQWRSTVNVKHQVMQCLQGRSEVHIYCL